MIAVGKGKANKWGIPNEREREPGVLYMHPTYSKKFYEGLKAIEVYGVRFVRVTGRGNAPKDEDFEWMNG